MITPTFYSVPSGELLSPVTNATDIDSSMHDIDYLDEGFSLNTQDSDDEGSFQDAVAKAGYSHLGVDQSMQCTMESSLRATSSEKSDEYEEGASQKTNQMPASEHNISLDKPKERTLMTTSQDSDEDLEVVSQSEESDEDADIIRPPTHDITMTDISEGDESEKSDDDELSNGVKPVRKIVVQMMKETKFQPNAKQHTFYNDNGTLISPIHSEYTIQGTDLREWF